MAGGVGGDALVQRDDLAAVGNLGIVGCRCVKGQADLDIGDAANVQGNAVGKDIADFGAGILQFGITQLMGLQAKHVHRNGYRIRPVNHHADTPLLGRTGTCARARAMGLARPMPHFFVIDIG